LLFEFIRSIKTAVSIHGHERNDKIFVGGLNSLLRKDVAFELEKHFPKMVICEIEEILFDLRGASPLNIVNQPLEKGVQIELPEVLRPMDHNYDNPVENDSGLVVAKAISNAVKRGAGRY
jgi:phage replication-related protein YjqB (UPF0714/DUF867 family)